MARIPSMKTAGVGLAALVGFALSIGQSFAQDATTHWIKAGFARPTAEGKADGTDGIGGTIYFAVYQLQPGKEKSNDPYNTGVPELTQHFVPGGGLSQSPANLVPESMPKYLYLYQVVNDKGLDKVSKDGVRFPSNTEVATRDIGSLILRLPVEARSVSSWGYFRGLGFVLNALDRGAAGQARPAALPPIVSLAVSANPSILIKLHELAGALANQQIAPSIDFKAGSGFDLGKADQNLRNSYFAEELRGRKDKLVAWEVDALKAATNGGTAPEAVDLVKGDSRGGMFLQVKFASPLKPGQHGVVLGFTTSVPPSVEVARLVDTASTRKEGIRTVGMDEIDFGAAGALPLPKEQVEAAAPEPTPVAPTPVGVKSPNLVIGALTLPADLPSSMLVDKGSYRAFGATVYFAVYRKVGTPTVGDSWGTGRTDIDSNFVPGDSYRSTVSPALDTTAQFLYIYQVVNDRGYQDLKLPQNQTTMVRMAALGDPEGRPSVVREVASFSLFLKTDPRLITSWGFFEDSGFNISVPTLAPGEARPVGMAEGATTNIRMAASANLSILDTLFPKTEKVYKPWAPAQSIDTGRVGFDVGKDTLNIDKKTRIIFASNDQTNSLQTLALRKLAKVKQDGSNRPDYVQLIYFDRPTSTETAAFGASAADRAPTLNIDGITLGSTEVAKAIFKVEWLGKPIESGQQSLIFGFTSNAEPVRAPIRLKDRSATLNTASEIQERVFLSPERIKAVALASAAGRGITPGVGGGIGLASLNGSADEAALAVASGAGNGIVPAGIASAAAGSVGNGIGLAAAVATPGEGGPGTPPGGGAGFFGVPPDAGGGSPPGGLGLGGIPGIAGGLGGARAPSMGGGGGQGSGGGQGTPTQAQGQAQGQGQGQGTSIIVQTSNAQQQQQAQEQHQGQHQGQHQNQHQNQHQHENHNHHPHHGNVVPAPPSLLLALLGLPALALAYRRRGAPVTTETPAEETPTTDA
jgi:hypothetical protein